MQAFAKFSKEQQNIKTTKNEGVHIDIIIS